MQMNATKLNVPLIVMDGAAIYDAEQNIYLQTETLDPEETGSIIPNYFAPFERRNVEIWYSSKPADIVMLRGDGDQDRP
jgi:hypothetical protein